MSKLYTLLLLVVVSVSTFGQSATSGAGSKLYFDEKEFSKDVALFKAKYFLFSEILGISEDVSLFEVIPLASASSGELTTLLYRSEEKSKEGLVLGFFGDYWNDAGVVFKGYGFRDLDREEAFEFLEKISNAMDGHSKFLKSNNDSNNIYFKYKDIDVLISYSGNYQIRLFWNGFDSTWENTAFNRSKRRFERKIK